MNPETAELNDAVYEYTITCEWVDGGKVHTEAVCIDATDVSHAMSEMLDDGSLWPDGAHEPGKGKHGIRESARIVSIVRGEVMYDDAEPDDADLSPAGPVG
jgi:hypothetical protein